MKENDLYDALSGIDKKYITESENFEAVAAAFRKDRRRKKRVIISMVCVAFVGAGIIGVTKTGLLKKDNGTIETDNRLTKSNGVEEDTVLSKDKHTDTVEQQSFNDESDNELNSELNNEWREDSINDNSELYYSKLVNNTQSPELDGYNDIAATLAVLAFDESMLKDAVGVVEGEIVDIWVNHYDYTTRSDKFEPDGQLYHKSSTVAYKIRIDRVLAGDFIVGDEVTVEDYYFITDSIVSIKKGSHYVIPIAKGDGMIDEHDDIISGSNILESSFYTMYQFHPQIEKVSGGYIVPDDWKTLVTSDCMTIIMDVDEPSKYYYGSMYYVPESVFGEKMSLLLQ